MMGQPQRHNLTNRFQDEGIALSENPETPLKEITAIVRADFDAVNALILDQLQSEIDLIPQLASHLIQAGGKRIRPLLTLAAAKLCDYHGQSHIDLAAAVEFIHSATLLHDDVVDESLMRRGNATANAVWGNQAPILVGDFLFSRAFQLMVRSESMAALKVLADTATILAEGEVMQLVDAGNLDIVEGRYIDIITAKTATLFESACVVSGIISGNGPEQEDALKTYGSSLGICFQIIDDVLDYGSSSQVLGKQVGDDLRDKKVTLPVIYAYTNGTSQEKTFWERIFTQDHTVTDLDLAQAQTYLQNNDALTYCRDKAAIYAQNAKCALEIFPDSRLKKLMQNLVDFSLSRKY